MELEKYSAEQLRKMSMMEVAQVILTDQKIELNFIALFNQIAELKGFSSAQKDDLLSQFYTDLNVDGRFSTLGENKWGLKRWYKLDQISKKTIADLSTINDESLESELLEDDEFYDEDETLEDGLDEVLEDDEGEKEEEEVI